MHIPSRTPEGEANHCPICGQLATIDPSEYPTPDAPCPHCGSLLWFTGSPQAPTADGRERIKRVKQEVAALSGKGLGPVEYYCEFLTRVLTALQAISGAVWVRNTDGNLALQCQGNGNLVGLGHESNRGLVCHAIEMKRACIAWSDGGSLTPNRPGQSAGYAVLVAPIYVDHEAAGAVQAWVDSSRSEAALRGMLQFLIQMAGLAAPYVASVGATPVAKARPWWKLW